MFSASVFPKVGISAAAVSILFCLFFGNFYFDDLQTIPYISYVSGRYPFLPIFSGGLTVTGTCIAIMTNLYASIVGSRNPKLFPYVGVVLAFISTMSIIGGFSLAALSLVSVYDSVILHTVFAQVFFWTNLLASLAVTIVSFKEHKILVYRDDSTRKRAVFWLRYRFVVILSLPIVTIPYLLLPAFVDTEKNPWVDSLSALLQYISVTLVIMFFLSMSFDLSLYELNMKQKEDSGVRSQVC
ncbi:hypothetical protein P9112_000300 [Eukaryota sp. TZLM1-RC]